MAFLAKTFQRSSLSKLTFRVCPIRFKSDYFTGNKLNYTSNLSLNHVINSYYTVPYPNVDVTVGENIHGFIVQECQPIDELGVLAVTLKHESLNTEYLHLACNDTENTFSVAFKTIPMDNSGIPHILEHMVLCGSEKYAVRDPFFKMLNRSLSTFMNAMTSSDYTYYPFSTQNKQDFINLMDVYLDSVLHPLLRKCDFLQEGWRLEHENLDNVDSEIIFKGVVFNEMKGAYQSFDNYYGMELQKCLLPSGTYSYDFGGHPMHIPSLTLENLKKFYTSFYHPSNSKLYSYGNFSLRQHLKHIQSNFLSKFDIGAAADVIHRETGWTSPQRVERTCPVDKMASDSSKTSTLSVNYILGDAANLYETFLLSMVSNLLVEGPAAPFYESLISSNIGLNYSPSTGFSDTTRDTTFSVGLQGISPEDEAMVEETIMNTLKSVSENGFSEERVFSLLHQIELGLRHQTSLFGIKLLSSLLSSWIHGGKPADALKVDHLISTFTREFKSNPQLLQNIVKERFLNNDRKLTFVMRPDEQFNTNQIQHERELLIGKLDGLTSQDKLSIHQQGLELSAMQSSKESLDCLPNLKINDVEREIKPVATQVKYFNGIPVQLSTQPTHQVNYLRIFCDTSGVPEELVPYLGLFSSILTEIGAGEYNFVQFGQLMERYSGGISSDYHLSMHHSNVNLLEQGIVISGHCLEKNFEQMLHIMRTLFTNPLLDDLNRLKTLILNSASGLSNSLPANGHSYSMSLSNSSVSKIGHLQEVSHGLTHIRLLKQLAQLDDLSVVIDKLKKISSIVLSVCNIRCALNCSMKNLQAASDQLEAFLSELGSLHKSDSSLHFYKDCSTFTPLYSKNHVVLPYQINFASSAMKSCAYASSEFAALQVMCRLLFLQFLHKEIREKGGAYGSGSVVASGASVSFFSYRDPNHMKTFDVFDQSGHWILNGDFSSDDLNGAKLGVLGKMDSPVPPGSRGQRLFLHGISDAVYQQHKNDIFSVTKEHVQAVANKYILNHSGMSQTLLGPSNEAIPRNWIVSSADENM